MANIILIKDITTRKPILYLKSVNTPHCDLSLICLKQVLTSSDYLFVESVSCFWTMYQTLNY
jgi:hypothetical protein